MHHCMLAEVVDLVEALVQTLAPRLSSSILEVAEEVRRGAGRGVGLLPPLEQHLLAEAQLGGQVGDVADGEAQSLDLGQSLARRSDRWRQVGPEVMKSFGQIPHPQLLLLAGALPLLAADPARPPATSRGGVGRGLEVLGVPILSSPGL